MPGAQVCRGDSPLRREYYMNAFNKAHSSDAARDYNPSRGFSNNTLLIGALTYFVHETILHESNQYQFFTLLSSVYRREPQLWFAAIFSCLRLKTGIAGEQPSYIVDRIEISHYSWVERLCRIRKPDCFFFQYSTELYLKWVKMVCLCRVSRRKVRDALNCAWRMPWKSFHICTCIEPHFRGSTSWGLGEENFSCLMSSSRGR